MTKILHNNLKMLAKKVIKIMKIKWKNQKQILISTLKLNKLEKGKQWQRLEPKTNDNFKSENKQGNNGVQIVIKTDNVQIMSLPTEKSKFMSHIYLLKMCS